MVNNLKYELRQRYGSGRSINLFDDTEHLEDGLLERIVNLSILNPNVFPNQKWTMLAVKSSATKHKLASMCSGEEIVSVSAVCLIVLEEKLKKAEAPELVHEDKQLLKTSVMYASKYYCVDSYVTDDFNSDAIRKYFNIASSMDIVMLICLGSFNCTRALTENYNLKSYSQTVREV